MINTCETPSRCAEAIAAKREHYAEKRLVATTQNEGRS
jgi:hypothetical protein